MKREVVKEPGRPARRRNWLAVIAVIGAIAALGIGAWLFGSNRSHTQVTPSSSAAGEPDTGRFAPDRPVTRADLETLRWEQINPLLQAIAADKTELERLTRLAGEVDAPPAAYLRGLLLILQEKPETALSAFEHLDPEIIPASLLYAPHRLHRTLHPGRVDPYLVALRRAVADGNVPRLIGARVQSLDGELNAALDSYLQTDPGTWVAYDLDSLRRISAHQGLAADLRRLIAGALASGRVRPTLVAPLQELARQGRLQPDQQEFKEQLRREIEADTPAGRIAVESAKRLLNDRNLFLAQEHGRLVETHSDDDPMALPTETVLLLFLSSVELKEQVEMDRWGQELKRRHREIEVRDWVNETMSAAR